MGIESAGSSQTKRHTWSLVSSLYCISEKVLWEGLYRIWGFIRGFSWVFQEAGVAQDWRCREKEMALWLVSSLTSSRRWEGRSEAEALWQAAAAPTLPGRGDVQFFFWLEQCWCCHLCSDMITQWAYFCLDPSVTDGEGNVNPLQYSCLEKPTGRGAWWATVHGVPRVEHNLATKPPSVTEQPYLILVISEIAPAPRHTKVWWFQVSSWLSELFFSNDPPWPKTKSDHRHECMTARFFTCQEFDDSGDSLGDPAVRTTGGSMGSIPGWGTKILNAVGCGKKKNKTGKFAWWEQEDVQRT